MELALLKTPAKWRASKYPKFYDPDVNSALARFVQRVEIGSAPAAEELEAAAALVRWMLTEKGKPRMTAGGRRRTALADLLEFGAVTDVGDFVNQGMTISKAVERAARKNHISPRKMWSLLNTYRLQE